MTMIVTLLAAMLLVQAPAGWEAVQTKASALEDELKFAEAIAVLDPYAAKWPNFPGVHEQLGKLHLTLANVAARRRAAGDVERRAHLERAATHYRRVIDLDPDAPPAVQMELADMHDPSGLNKPAEWEFYSRRLVEKRPGALLFRTRLADVLAQTGRQAEAVRMLHEARAVTPDPMPSWSRGALGLHMTTFVMRTPTLTIADVKLLLEDALAIAKDEISRNAKDADSYLLRAKTLQLLAERVETDPARKTALLRESDAASQQYTKMQPR